MSEVDEYKKLIVEKLERLTPVFARAAVGDFSQDVVIPKEDDEFIQIFVGVQVILEVVREQLEQLRNQREEFRALVEDSPDIIARFDRGLRHVYVNKAVKTVAGKPSWEFIGKTNRDLGMPETLASYWEEHISTVFRTGKADVIEFDFPGADGKTHYYHSRLVPEFDTVGNIAFVLGISRDITELKEVQLEAQNLARIVENSDEAIMSFTTEGIITSWNKGAERVYGYTKDEIVGKSKAMLIPPDRPDELAQLLDKFRNNMMLEHYETRRMRKDGKLIYTRNTYSQIPDASGKIVAIASLSNDITFRREAEAMLLENTKEIELAKAKLDSILISMADGLFVTDGDGVITLINDVALHFASLRREDALGKKYTDVFHFAYEKNPEKQYPDFVGDVFRTGEATGVINHSVIVQSESVAISITHRATPLIDGEGNVCGCVVVLRDNREQRELERSKDEFISVAAHQLRTPLGIMRWSIEELLDEHKDRLPEAVQDKVRDMYSSNQRMIALVNDFLSVSRIEQGRLKSQAKEVELVPLIRRTLEDLDPQIRKQNLQIVFDDAGLVKIVNVDPARLEDAIKNILSNAIKYNKPGGRIAVRLKQREGEVEVSVHDSGIGIPQEDQDKIFSKFFRSSNAVLSDADGSGLGLFIVKSYVEEWGGRIWFTSPSSDGVHESPASAGTSVFFTIPLEQKSESETKEGT